MRNRDDTDAEGSFDAFVLRREPSLLRTAYLLTGDHGHAEDLVQTALLKAFRHWARVSRDGEPLAYVRRIMVNANRSRLRLFASSEQVLEDVPDRPVDSAEIHAADDELREALLELPPKMRAVLVLRYFDDLTEAQTAQILGCATSTVSTHAARGLARLRAKLSDRAPAPASEEGIHR